MVPTENYHIKLKPGGFSKIQRSQGFLWQFSIALKVGTNTWSIMHEFFKLLWIVNLRQKAKACSCRLYPLEDAVKKMRLEP